MNIKKLCIAFCFCLSIVSCNDGGENDEKATVYNNQGIVFFNNSNYEKAIEFYKKAVQLDKVSRDIKLNALRNLAQAFIQSSQKDSAIHYLNLAISLSKSNSYAYYVNNADKLLLNDSTYQALLHLEKAEKIDKGDISAINMLGLIYLGEYGVEFKNPKKALDYNLRAYKVNKDRNAGYVLALNHFKLKSYYESIQLLEELNRSYPDNAEQHFLLGKCKYYTNNKYGGDIAFNKVISIDSDYKANVTDFKEEYAVENEDNEAAVNEVIEMPTIIEK